MLFQSILSSALGLLVFAVVTSREKASVVVAAIDCNSLTCTDLGSFKTYKYGDSFVTVDEYDNQVGDLYIPTIPIQTPIPIVVLIHGGYWYDQYRRNGSDMRPLALDLVNKGYAVVNLEYRRASSSLYTNGNGRIPGTLNDIGNGIDALSCQSKLQTECGYTAILDTSKVAVVGHSAGGHLGTFQKHHIQFRYVFCIFQ